MTYDHLLALSLFAFVSSVTPGPNNIMLLSSGANFGFRSTVPHMLGIAIGFVSLVLLVGLGLGRVFTELPILRTVLQVCAVMYLIWLACRIALSVPDLGGITGARPLTLLQAAAFQWVNPKGWAMALTANAAYGGTGTLESALITSLLFGAINLPSVSVWALLGREIRHVLQKPGRFRVFNGVLAFLMLGSLYPLIFA